ncbi:MAG TPA: pyrroloquinoline quinone biosynthesis protein PqqB, partial [Pirellulales bacterium]|nr:pyrroloquinoline quinone biosynthesis protein PqqB [Pirellulales bacterium]
MRVRILGSAAGGGLPQWNCRCANCAAVRAGVVHVRPRTQSSVALSADGQAWFLLNVSPDIRQQILAFSALGPAVGTAPRGTTSRGTGITGCVLTDAELDHAAGLLFLREGGVGHIHCTATVRRWLNRWFPVEPILASFSHPLASFPSTIWRDLPIDAACDLCLPDGSPSGLRVHAFEVARHVPRFVNDDQCSDERPEGKDTAAGSVVGLRILDAKTGGLFVYAPCVGSLDDPLKRVAREADCLLFDGTFWDDDEPIRCGIGSRTARAMGHLPVGGPEGSLSWLSGLSARHRVYVHINNTNPVLDERGPEHRLVTERGVRVGADGDSFEL